VILSSLRPWVLPVLAGLALLVPAGVALAEAPRLKGLADHEPGPHGGAIADAGPYHIELVIDGTTLSVRLYDSEVKLATGHYGDPLPVARIGAEAILLINSAKETVKLEAGDAVTLSGRSAATPDASLKAVIRLQVPDQRPLQARFVPIGE
jgi:hypothetical protein